jgi:hypothetical protein
MPTEQRDQLLHLLNDGVADRIRYGRQETSQEAINQAWRQWCGHCESFGQENRFKPTKNKRSSLPSPNASEKVPSLPETVKSHYLRRLSASPLTTWHRSLGVTTGQAPSTASTTMSAYFPALKEVMKAWSNLDPKENRQCAITSRHLRFLHEYATTTEDPSTSDFQSIMALLASGAFFYACRSCEYLKVTGLRKTKQLRCSDFEFIRADGSIIPFNHPDAESAAVRVMVTF